MGIGGGRKRREAAAAGVDVAGVEARGNLREREKDVGGLPSLERSLVAADRQGGGEGVVAQRWCGARATGITRCIAVGPSGNGD